MIIPISLGIRMSCEISFGTHGIRTFLAASLYFWAFGPVNLAAALTAWS